MFYIPEMEILCLIYMPDMELQCLVYIPDMDIQRTVYTPDIDTNQYYKQSYGKFGLIPPARVILKC